MKNKKADDIPLEILISDYELLNSSYKVAEKHKVSATAIKRILGKLGVLRTQKAAAKIRNATNEKYFAGNRKPRSDEFKEKMRKHRLNNKSSGMKGKTHSPEVRAKLSESAKSRTGKRNPNYKNGNYQRRPRDYKQAEFTKLRNFVFNRDKYTCKYCLNLGGHLHAHHILPYWVTNEAYLDVENLITVCTDCHFNKAHLQNWHKFDVSIVTDYLLIKYSLNRERLNELAGLCPDAKV